MRWIGRMWKRHFLGMEFGVSILIWLAFAFWTTKLGGLQVVNATLQNNRSAVYGTIATVAGSLLGFAITAVSIILIYTQSESEHMRILRGSKHYPTLWRVFIAAIRSLGLVTGVGLVGLVVDRDAAPNALVLNLFVWSVSLAVLRLMRCLWALENMISVSIAQAIGASDKA